MTTCAYDGKFLAVDSRSTNNNPVAKEYKCPACGESHAPVKDDTVKIHGDMGERKYRGEKIFAMAGAGHSSTIKRVTEAVRAGEDLDELYRITSMMSANPRLIDAAFLVVTEHSVFKVRPGEGGGKHDVQKFARGDQVVIGSGGQAAMATMKVFGLNAIEALLAASVTDQGTGGAIRWVDTSQPAGKPESHTTMTPPNEMEITKRLRERVAENRPKDQELECFLKQFAPVTGDTALVATKPEGEAK
jgi:hypothetical protein